MAEQSRGRVRSEQGAKRVRAYLEGDFAAWCERMFAGAVGGMSFPRTFRGNASNIRCRQSSWPALAAAKSG